MCTNTEGSFTCACRSGYKGDGKTCKDINECEGVNDCDVNAMCTNTEGSFTCACRSGYKGDGKTCEALRCDLKSDIGFILDSSGSVSAEYPKEKEFIQRIAGAFRLGENQSRASVVTFSDHAELSIRFNEFYDQASFDRAVSEIRFFNQGTRIDKALLLAGSQMFKIANGARGGVPDTLILLTDGRSQGNNEAIIAKALRRRGVNIIVVGITNSVNEKALQDIAGDPSNYFTAENFDILISEKFIERLQVKTCETVTKMASGTR